MFTGDHNKSNVLLFWGLSCHSEHVFETISIDFIEDNVYVPRL